MTTRWRTVAIALLASAATVAATAASPGAASRPPLKALHPDFALLDAQGVNVLASGRAASTMKSCGQCHDARFIASHAFHADLGLKSFAASKHSWNASPGLFGQWDPLRYRYLTQAGDERLDLSTAGWLMFNGDRVVGGGPATTSRSGKPLAALKPDAADPEASLLAADGKRVAWNWADSGTLEMGCFLCHLEKPNVAARSAAIRAGRFAEANTATLTGLGVVEATPGGWSWNRAAFTADGLIESRKLSIQDPTNANCAACHEQSHATTGEVIASQRIDLSGANIAGKSSLVRAWDIHAERQLRCTDCHHALNNPAHVNVANARRPAHLRYDPRTLEINEYLQRPDHDFARGQSAQVHVAPEGKGTMRRCESCHDAGVSHAGWLPYVQTHMATLACESCHIPKMHAGAIESYDWTVLAADGTPVQAWRGVQGDRADIRSLVTGFDPVLMKRVNVDGAALLAPYNLVTSFYWVYDDANGNKRPVRLADLKAAFFDGGAYAADLVPAFDMNHDGVIGPAELRIDSPQKASAVKARLAKLGLQNARMEGQVQPFSISHGVARGAFALNDCADCHGARSRPDEAMQLAAFAPVMPSFAAGNNVVASGRIVREPGGALSYRPEPKRDGLYIFGATRVAWVDLVGALAFAGTLAGVAGHGTLRYMAWRKRPRGAVRIERVQMYDAYRRFWHWLQAISIVALLATGVVIHRPDLFAAFSFPGVVTLHNVLAAIVILNAALALFYHLATERMREYLPRPYGFFDDSMRQARYYLSGIFKGEPHPFEKRPDDRMNPIQKLTYFGIINVLLPAQVVTGAAMWGLQRWPEVAGAFGGLPVLAPVHCLLAWLFASFIVAHVYLTTTGATPLEGIRGMVTGVERVEVHEPLPEH